MTNPHQREVAVFEAALQLPPEQREAYLDRTCGDDLELRERIRALLRADEDQTDLLEPSVRAPGMTFGGGALPAETPGDQIGPYKLLQQIGEGGCGLVYMAEQAEPIQRRVALKIIKLGMDTKQVVARFDAERHALALMDHPNIARVLDVGATETGRPYFVMELVRGVKMTDYCDQNHLSTRERLELFIQVCRAVQHAHQKGIIHRDLKPSNILVTVNDGVAVPKVIDFGIAKATQGRLTDQTVFTAFEQFIGTPAYMSPEQAAMTSVDIDTRSDIYSLGVLLYELLTGKTPFDTNELLAAGLDQMRRTICETQPARPSTRLNTLGEGELTTTALRRKVQPPELVHLVRDDLDWIVMKCLEKDRARRYETANGLAMDIQRHLNCEPVVARPPSRLYEFQKTVRRHKFGFGATAALIVVLAAGVLVSAREAVRARRAERAQIRLREVAQEEAAKSKQVSEFLEDMLKGAGPAVALGRETPVLREILDRTAERLDELTNQPAVEAELRATLGRVYFDLGLYPRAEAMQRQALALRTKLLGKEDLSVAESLNDLGLTLHAAGKWAEAETNLRTALALQQKLLGPTNNDVAGTLQHLGSDLRAEGRRTEAEPLLRRAVAMRKLLLGEQNLEVASALSDLGILLSAEGKLPQAETNFSESLAIFKKLLPSQHPSISGTLADLGGVLGREGKYAEAEPLLRETLTTQEKVLGLNHRLTQITLLRLADVLRKEGKGAEAEGLLRNAAHAGNTRAMTDLADMNRFGEGMPTNAPEALKWYQKAADAGDVRGMVLLGDMNRGARNFPQARDIYSDVIRLKPDSVQAWAGRGDCDLHIGDFSDMAKDYSEAIRLKPDRGWYWHERAYAYQSLGEFKQAISDHSKCIELNDNDADERWRRGRAYETLGDFPDAVADYSRAIALDPGHWQYWEELARVDSIQYGPDKARADLAEAAKRCSAIGTPDDQVSLAWTLAENGDPRLRDGSTALKLAEKAVASTSHTNRAFLGMLAVAYAEAGQFTNAVNMEREALHSETNPEKIKLRTFRLKLFEARIPYDDPLSLNNTAWSFATSPFGKVRNGKLSVALAQEAVSLTSRTNASFVDTLAAACAETGDFARAVAIEKESITLLTDKKAIADYTKRLKLYEANTPYRKP